MAEENEVSLSVGSPTSDPPEPRRLSEKEEGGGGGGGGISEAPFDKLLQKIFYEDEGPASYGSHSALYREAKKQNSKVRHKDIKQFLENQTVYQRHKRFYKTFPRRKVTGIYRIDNTWCIDTCFFDNLSSYNSHYTGMVVCKDIFSDFVWIRKIVRKTHKEISQCLTDIVEKNIPNGPPLRCWTDKGYSFFCYITFFVVLCETVTYTFIIFFSIDRSMTCRNFFHFTVYYIIKPILL